MPADTGRSSAWRGLPARLLLAPIKAYQTWISPALPPRCRFYPTCSAYAVEAVSRHGAVKGLWLSVVRLAKCGPWHSGGVDHVPPLSASSQRPSTQNLRSMPHHPLENHA